MRSSSRWGPRAVPGLGAASQHRPQANAQGVRAERSASQQGRAARAACWQPQGPGRREFGALEELKHRELGRWRRHV